MPEPAGLPRFWNRSHEGQRLPAGQHLAQLRRGLGRSPGSVPGMWPHYSELTADGRIGVRLRAEHIALGLFGVHQQSEGERMHRVRVGLGEAARRLRDNGRYSPDAVDRRVVAAASASSVDSLAVHLRGLVQQFSVVGQPLDYDRLLEDLVRWQNPEGAGRVRRRWGGDYYRTRPGPDPAGTARLSDDQSHDDPSGAP